MVTHPAEEGNQAENDHQTNTGDFESEQPVNLVVEHSNLTIDYTNIGFIGGNSLGESVAGQDNNQDNEDGDSEGERQKLGNLVGIHFLIRKKNFF